ncbi:diguanylate cyclase [Deinococcus sp.]|uniref:diguanylate cyclase n=1 Tax=Deinococcus sp. TaxID=47478 RepID=UPI003CC5AE01
MTQADHPPPLESRAAERSGLSETLQALAQKARDLRAQGNDDALAEVAARLLALAAERGDDAALAEGLSYAITAEQRRGQYLRALELLRQEVEVRARLGDWVGEVECLSNLGLLYATLGDHAEALTTLFQCQQLSMQYADVPAELRAACLVNIGHTYLSLRQFTQALDYLLPGLELSVQSGDIDTQLSALSQLGLVYKAQGQYSLAVETLTRGLRLAQTSNPQELIDLTDNLGQVYSDMGDDAQADELFGQSLRQSLETGDLQGRVNAQLSLGRLRFKQGAIDAARALLQEALDTALSHNLRQSALELHQALYLGFEEVGDLATAFQHLRAYQELAGKLFDENGERRVQTLTARFEAERARHEADMYRKMGEVSQAARLQAEETVRVRTAELEAAQIELVTRLGMASEYRDDETGQHTRRVGELAGHLAQAIGLPPETVDLIRWAARLHDIGKIGVPDSVLLKPGRYTPEEFERMKTHTVIGAKVLEGSTAPLLQMAEEIARTHHERWDGRGYPKGLAGEAIPVSGRVVAVADVFDALTTARLYKPAWSVEEALREMQTQSGMQFDPQLITSLTALITSNLSSLEGLFQPRASALTLPERQPPSSLPLPASDHLLAELIERAWHLRQSQPKEAEELAEEALRRAEKGGDELLLGLAHRNVGFFRFMSSAFEQALGHFVRGLDIGVAHGQLSLQADCANFMAGVYNALSDYDKALDQLSTVLRIAREQQNRQREAHCLHNLAIVSKDSRSLDKASSYLVESLTVYREIGDMVGETKALGTHAELAFEQGDDELCIRLADRAAQQARSHAQPYIEALAQSTAGKAHSRLGQDELAETLQQRALIYASEAGYQQMRAWSLYELGQVRQKRGNPQAQQDYLAALGLAQELSVKELEMQAYRSLSELSAAAGDAERALDYYRRHHAVELDIFNQEASLKTRALMVQLEVERAQSDAQIYKLRSIELASANEALARANVEKSGLVNMLESQSKLLQRQLSEDGLTGLYNRKHIEGLLQHEFWQQKSSAQLLCIAMVDLDHFKLINDRFSHLVGDQVLRLVAQIFTQTCRPSDAVGRYGGEEFLFVFPGTTLEQGRRVCERIQAAVRGYGWDQVHPGLQVTLSIGVVSDLNVPNHERLIARADTKLYEAKNSGRDRVCF